MPWFYLAIISVGGLVLAALLCLLIVRRLGNLEPYSGFVRLRNRRKLTFFRLLLQDQRVPLYVKLLPLLVVAYLASPIDLLPGIPVDDIALALLALVLIVKLTPRQVLEDLLNRAAAEDVLATPESAGAARAPKDSCNP